MEEKLNKKLDFDNRETIINIALELCIHGNSLEDAFRCAEYFAVMAKDYRETGEAKLRL